MQRPTQQRHRPWGDAMAEALTGPSGFYRRSRAREHFRTAAGSPSFAAALHRLAGLVDRSLGHPDPFDLVDLGAGDGALLAGLAALDPPGRWRLVAVDVAGRPATLRPEVAWTDRMPRAVHGLVVANEWLDNLPVDVVTRHRGGLAQVLVGTDGNERIGPLPGPDEAAWTKRWWSLGTGDRAEVGLRRDQAWAGVVACLAQGVAVACDYGHTRDDRPAGGTLAGYRSGRRCRPVPDGSCDVTAHVAVDAVAATCGGTLLRQREALRALGLCPVPLPRPDLPAREALAMLQRRAEVAELTDPGGWGGFWWVVAAVGIPVPATLVGPAPTDGPDQRDCMTT